MEFNSLHKVSPKNPRKESKDKPTVTGSPAVGSPAVGSPAVGSPDPKGAAQKRRKAENSSSDEENEEGD